MSEGATQSEKRSCSVVWSYGRGYFCIFFQMEMVELKL